MTKKENLREPAIFALAIIVVSLLFAGLMIGVSHLLRGSDFRQTAVFLVLAVWWIPFSALTQRAGFRCEQRNCR